MATLHIEHPISDLPASLGAFSRFREARRRAVVRAERVLHPVDDDKYSPGLLATDFELC